MHFKKRMFFFGIVKLLNEYTPAHAKKQVKYRSFSGVFLEFCFKTISPRNMFDSEGSLGLKE